MEPVYGVGTGAACQAWFAYTIVDIYNDSHRNLYSHSGIDANTQTIAAIPDLSHVCFRILLCFKSYTLQAEV